MTPEEKRQFEELKKEVAEIKSADGYAMITDSIFIDSRDVTDTDVQISTAIGGMGGTVNHLDFPDRWAVLRYKGKPYLTPLYNFTRLG